MISFELHKSLHAAFGPLPLSVSLQMEAGGFAAIYGPSGAGKTTILRMLAGLLPPDSGRISFGDSLWLDTERKVCLPPQRRPVGFVFQDYALFPNMTVRGNLEYAGGKDAAAAIAELAAIMELEQLMNRYPAALSGGQQQRVALARALVRQPGVLLLDEPLSALHHQMRYRLQEYILKVHNAFGLTTILVSHNISEIYRMARLVFVIEHGRFVKQGTPADVFGAEAPDGKIRFIGEVLDVEAGESGNTASVLIHGAVLRVVVGGDQSLAPGDRVLVTSDSFDPVVIKMQQ